MSDAEEGLIEVATDILADGLSGVPAPIRKNAFKAFAQLCTAAVDIPVAHLEGKAIEKRAETAARVKIIETGADQIADQMHVDPEYAHAAVRKYGQRIVREQINLDSIAQNAALQLTHQPSESTEEIADISDDWLNTFEREASSKSSEEMQQLWGKILAGEIKRPGTYSLRTMDTLKSITPSDAELFSKLAAFAFKIGRDPIVLNIDKILEEIGIAFSDLLVLSDLGLIHSTASMLVLNLSVREAGESTHVAWGDWLIIIAHEEAVPEVALPSIMFTKIGLELLALTSSDFHEGYLSALCSRLKGGKKAKVTRSKILSNVGDKYTYEDTAIEVQ